MTQEEIKNDLLIAVSEIVEAISKIGSDENTTEHLSVVKSRSNRLLKNASNMLDVEEPEFKVGDYVVEQNGNVISKIEEVVNDRFRGSYFKRINNHFYGLGCIILPKDIERHATPEEIAEYKAALNFHKHGRKPFEIRQGDITSDDEGYKFFIGNPNIWDKEDFTSGKHTLLKTAEEVNEWLGVADE